VKVNVSVEVADSIFNPRRLRQLRVWLQSVRDNHRHTHISNNNPRMVDSNNVFLPMARNRRRCVSF
jgi:hypothetical protein